jgi:hypothetical protein
MSGALKPMVPAGCLEGWGNSLVVMAVYLKWYN